jgi:hypothetical protein
MVRAELLWALAALLAGCANVDYQATRAGEFKGEVVLIWVGGSGDAGDGRFVFVPNPRRPLTFTRPGDGGRVVAPGMIYTDGGSIPRIGQVFRGLSPWNYGPAYVVHDWLFRARQCLNDKIATPEEAAIEGMEFQESAEVIAEAIKALEESGRVRPDDISGPIVTLAVTSPVSRDLWRKEGACERVSAPHREAALNAVGRTTRVGALVVPRTTVMVDGAPVPVPPAEIVGVFSF